MNALEVPTDNLYKFMAIAGLVTFIACTYLIAEQRRQLTREVFEFLIGKQSLQADMGAFQKELETVTEQTAQMYSRVQDAGNGVKDSQSLKLANDALALIQETTSLRKRWTDLESRMDRVEVERQHLNELSRQEWHDFFSLLAFEFIGLITSAMGFVLWYTRVQKYLDRDLKERAKALK